jgi:predicted enzyme related to lactoylglutathione lyase
MSTVSDEQRSFTTEAAKIPQPTLANGKVCYIEIPAADIERSVSFYRATFGWQIRRHKDGRVSFDDTVGEVSGAWVTGRKPSLEPGLLIYIMVDNVSSTIDKVIANGGKLVQPIGLDAPEITARFSDPSGNVLGLYQEPKGNN